jgi:plastocyanin
MILYQRLVTLAITPALVLAGAASLAANISACGGGDSTSPSAGLNLAKASPSGDAQTAVVGQALPTPLKVQVTRTGTGEAGASVSWSVTLGGGSLSAASTTTGADGSATVIWTLGSTSGPQSVRASLAGASGSPLTFTAIANPGPATQLRVSSGSGQRTAPGFPLPLPLAVVARDAFNNPVAGVDVTWAVVSGTATLNTTSGITGGDGVTLVTATLGQGLGPIAIDASASGLNGSPVRFTAIAVTPAELTADVDVGNNFFLPASVTIPAGALVRWTLRNTVSEAHNVTSIGTPLFPSSPQNMSGVGTFYEHRFETPGTFRYECSLHSNMSGTVIVQ